MYSEINEKSEFGKEIWEMGNEMKMEENRIRVGIDIGGTDTKIGLVDASQNIFARTKMKTNANRPPEEVIRAIGENVSGF